MAALYFRVADLRQSGRRLSVGDEDVLVVAERGGKQRREQEGVLAPHRAAASGHPGEAPCR